MLFRQGAPVLGEGALRTGKGVAELRAAAAAHLPAAGQLQVATALEVIDGLEDRLHLVRHQLTDAARHLAGAKAGSPPPARRPGSPGRGITVSSWDRKGPPGKLSRQGPPVLRWAVYEAGKTHAPDLRPRPPVLRRGQGPQEQQARLPVPGPHDPPPGPSHPGRARRRRARRRLTPATVTST